MPKSIQQVLWCENGCSGIAIANLIRRYMLNETGHDQVDPELQRLMMAGASIAYISGIAVSQ